MNHSAVLRRAFDITRRYRVLWLFGILIALTSGGSPGSSSSSYQADQSNFQGGNWPQWLPSAEIGREAARWLAAFDPAQFVGGFLACCCLIFLLILAGIVVQYVARVALIRSVDQIERTAVAPSWRAGLRLGWSHLTLRLFLLELIFGLVCIVVVLALFAVAAAPLLLLLIQSDAARVIGVLLTVLLALPVILFLIAAGIVVSVLSQLWARLIVLDDYSIGNAFAQGYALLRARVRDIGVFWLLMAGIQIGWMIVLIPVFFLLVVLGALVGGGLGWAIYSLANSVAGALLVGIPLFILILGIPLVFLGGLFATFQSTAWTLAYREVAPAG